MKKDFTFDEYLRDVCFAEADKEGIPVLDDDQEDYFETWLQQIDPDILIDIANRALKAQRQMYEQ